MKANSEIRSSRVSYSRIGNNNAKMNLVNLLSPPKDKKVFIKNAIRDVLVEKDMISFCKIFPIGLAPITMRKHLLYQQSRAG